MKTSPLFSLASLLDHTLIGNLVFDRLMQSTNDTGLELNLTSDLRDSGKAILVLAENQLAGRGRGEHQWLSSHGSLTFSLVFDLSLSEKIPIPLLGLVAGLSVCEAVNKVVASSFDRALIKWPNDVYIGADKVSGVLVESNASNVVVGIGINVNNEVPAKATSLAEVTSKEHELTAVLVQVLDSLTENLETATKDPRLFSERCQNSLSHLGREIQVESHGERIRGTNTGLGPLGELILDINGYQKSIVSAKNLQFQNS